MLVVVAAAMTEIPAQRVVLAAAGLQHLREIREPLIQAAEEVVDKLTAIWAEMAVLVLSLYVTLTLTDPQHPRLAHRA